MADGLHIDHDSITPTLGYMVLNGRRNVTDRLQKAAKLIEAYAKANAPWADRTGAARAGLTTQVYSQGDEVILELAHSVDYGQWLELIQDGRFAVIMPTLEKLGPAAARGALEGLYPGAKSTLEGLL